MMFNHRIMWLVLAFVLLVQMFNQFAISVFPPLFTEIIVDIPLTSTQMGTIMGVAMLTAIFSPIGGILSDWIGCRWVVGISILIAATAGGLRSVADTHFELVACYLGIGLGFNFMFPSMPKILGQWFPSDKLGFVNGIHMGFMALAGAGVTAIAASLLSPALGGWRAVMLWLGASFFIVGILWILLYRDPVLKDTSPHPGKKPLLLDNFKKVLKVRDIKLLSAMACIAGFGFIALIVFLPISLERRGIGHGGEFTAIFMGAAVLSGAVGGWFSDRIGRRKPILLYGMLGAGLCFLTLASLSGIPLIIMLSLAGACGGVLGPLFFTIPIELKEVGPKLAATAMSIIMLSQSVSGFLGPIIVGKLIDVTGSYEVGFFFIGGVTALSTVFALFMTETGRKRVSMLPLQKL
ncbi:MAG: MFS transporter [Deltaproteobacteria bacterium]|nr:MFS transporter [Deltaproteobacteria bacterium]